MSVTWEDVRVGDPLTTMTVDVTATVIVATAIATRDFMPVHHDRDYANSQGAPDIFMNILSDTGFCSRFLTDWGGPETMITRLAIKLGVPLFPGHELVYTGAVTGLTQRDSAGVVEGVVEVAFRATTQLGEHLSGTAVLTLPLR